MAHKLILTFVLSLVALIFQSFYSPFTLAFASFASAPAASAQGSACYPADRDALLSVAAWLKPDVVVQWGRTQDCCRWVGVTCSASLFNKSTLIPSSTNPMVSSGRVVGLALTGVWNGSDVPSAVFSAVCQLSSLVSLDLSSRKLFSNYVEVVYGSKIVGPVPTCFSHNLTSLQTLDLSFNRFSGSFSSLASALPHLTHLDLSSNDFRGNDVSFLQFSSRSLEYLDLSGNSLYGAAGVSFFKSLSTNLRHLDLSFNDELSLSLSPTAFSANPLLQYLSLPWQEPSDFRFLEHLQHLEELELEVFNFIPAHNLGSLFCKLGSLRSLVLFNGATLEEQSSSAQSTGSSVLSDKLACKKPASVNLTDLFLEGQGYTGPFPSWIAHFTKLQALELEGNRFQGSIPQEWQALTQLTWLSLSGDSPPAPISLSQEIQTWLFRLPLEGLHLQSMGLTSQDFPCTGFSLLNHTLHSLDLSNNHISAFGHSTPLHCLQLYNFSLLGLSLSENPLALPLQPYMLLVSSEVLNLSNCQLFGNLSGIETVPLGTYINLSHNNLTGSIPPKIVCRDRIEELDLSDNKLTGSIPSSFWNVNASVLVLKLDNNCLHDFHGKVDLNGVEVVLSVANNYLSRAYFYNVSYLVFLDLSNNQLGGTLESLLGDCSGLMQNLMVLLLNNNQLIGSIPSSLVASATSLIALDLSNNNLTGAIPPTLGQHLQAMQSKVSEQTVYMDFTLHSVKDVKSIVTEWCPRYLDFSANHLNGTIPDSLSALLGLQDLNLSRNQLSGPIPPSLARLVSLESLDLSFNNLEGIIPFELTTLSFLQVFNVSFNPELSGQIPEGSQLESSSSYEGDPKLCGQAINKNCTGEEQITEGTLKPTCGTGQQPNCNTLPTLGFKNRLASFIRWIEEWAAIPAIFIGYAIGVGITIWGLKSLHFYK